MTITRHLGIVCLSLFLLASCKSKKKISLSADDPVAVNDFIDFFEPLQLPYQLADTSLLSKKNEKDSLLISYKVFSQFVPDSILGKVYGKNAKPKIFAIGKVSVKDGETYIFVKTVNKEKRMALLVTFDKKQQFIAGMPVLQPDQKNATGQSVSIDRRYSITKKVLMKNSDGSISEGKDVYALNVEGKNFMLIMTDALDDKITELINPIDTLPRKHKFSADYSTGKMNLVSIRDGRKNDRLTFFIHFEKNNGECTGELKGEAILKTNNTAEYSEAGDPCKLKFIFSSSSVTLQEIEGCGSRRGMKCSFDGSFVKKKNPKPSANTKTTKDK